MSTETIIKMIDAAGDNKLSEFTDICTAAIQSKISDRIDTKKAEIASSIMIDGEEPVSGEE